jgi:putative flippase GtrA
MLVGVANTLVGTSIMFGLYNLAGWGYWPASMANYILSSILSFFLNRRFTFRTDERGWRPAARFALNILACYAVAYGVAKPLVRLMFAGAGDAVRDNLSMLTGMCLFTLLNYFGQKFFAFRERA